MPSFDIVSKVDMQEVDNAVNQAVKEIGQRYDFKGSKSQIIPEKDSVKILADDDYKLKAVIDVLQSKFLKRNISVKALQYGKVEPASGGLVRQIITVQQGISKEKAKDIIAIIKESKLKVQAQIQDDQVRVTGKNRDDLQDAIQLLKGTEIDVEMQFINFRE
ncbi:MAG TPA: YajQ family cyclic di-GMP-binding protein [Desulfuromonadales bacterium]|nr:YajQ family cyclic di-GMP-binding protein [Desulfuromonadales bacterium]